MKSTWILVSFNVLFMVGCATQNSVPLSFCGLQRDKPLAHLDAKKMLGDLVEPMCASLQTATSVPLVMADPVDLQTFQVDSDGLIWGQILRERVFNLCKIQVRETHIAEDFKIGSSGLTLLSRDLNRLVRPQFPLEVAIVSTVDRSEHATSVHLRAIDIASQAVLAEQSRSITWTCKQSPEGYATVHYHVE